MKFRNRPIKLSDKIIIGSKVQFTGTVVGIDDDNERYEYNRILLEVPQQYGWMGASAPMASKMYNLNPEKHYGWFRVIQITDHQPQICTCIECKQPNDWAQPNRADGSFLCYTCKRDYAWKYPVEAA